MYLQVHRSEYLHTRTHVYIYIYIYTHTRTHFCIVSPHLSIQAYLYWVPTCPCTPIFRGLNMSLSTYFRMWTSLHTDIYIYIYICAGAPEYLPGLSICCYPLPYNNFTSVYFVLVYTFTFTPSDLWPCIHIPLPSTLLTPPRRDVFRPGPI